MVNKNIKMNIVLFDGLCNMCNKTVLFLIKFDKKNNLHFAAQQTNAGAKIMNQYLVKQDARSVIFIKENLVYYQSDAIIEIAKILSGWPRIGILAVIFPKFLRNWVYDLVAQNRYKIFGKQMNCSIPSKANEHKFIK
jgi:predicted DCC family thiol-disulfide oxidoreductase YuxK